MCNDILCILSLLSFSRGDWDDDEEVSLQPSYVKRVSVGVCYLVYNLYLKSPAVISKETTLIRNVIDTLTKGDYDKVHEVINTGELTRELFERVQLQLIKFAVSNESVEVAVICKLFNIP